MPRGRNNRAQDSGCTFYKKEFECVCGYRFINNNCRLVDKIRKLHENRCSFGNEDATIYEDINLEINISGIHKTVKTIE